MITEAPNRLNIKDFAIDEPSAENLLRLRRNIYDRCSSNEMANLLLDRWRGFSHGKNRIIDGSLILMLFPGRRDSLDLTEQDLKIITDPPQVMDEYGLRNVNQIERINLTAAGRILFPEESREWQLDIENSKEELERQMLEFTLDPRKESFQHLFAVSEKILHKDLYPEAKGTYKYGVQLLENLGDSNDMKRSGFVTLDLQTIPGLIKILYPEKTSEFPLRADDLQNLLERIPLNTLSAKKALAILLAKATVAESVTIDAKGAHFTPPMDKKFTEANAVPNIRKF